MSDDWKPGDLALCINDEPSLVPGFDCEVRKGRFYTVSSVVRHPERQGLRFVDFEAANPYGHSAFRFRKIKPLTDEERDEFTADLNAPVREPAA